MTGQETTAGQCLTCGHTDPHTTQRGFCGVSGCDCDAPTYAETTAGADGLPLACPTKGCGGDTRYAAPGRGHVTGCKYPMNMLEEPATAGADGRRERLAEVLLAQRYAEHFGVRPELDPDTSEARECYLDPESDWGRAAYRAADAILASGFADEIRAAALAPIEALADEWAIAEAWDGQPAMVDRGFGLALRAALRADHAALGGRDRGEA